MTCKKTYGEIYSEQWTQNWGKLTSITDQSIVASIGAIISGTVDLGPIALEVSDEISKKVRLIFLTASSAINYYFGDADHTNIVNADSVNTVVGGIAGEAFLAGLATLPPILARIGIGLAPEAGVTVTLAITPLLFHDVL
jgi:hypothetical protein